VQTLTCLAAGAAAVTCWRGARFVRDVRTGFALARTTARFQRRVAATEPSRYFAVDGLHPSAASYRLCFDTIRRSTPLDAAVSRNSAAGKYCVHE
jgi:hypothetical protein